MNSPEIPAYCIIYPMEQNERLDIDRFKEFFENIRPIYEEDQRRLHKKHNEYKSVKEGRKRYELSEKGEEARLRAKERREERFKKACEGLSLEEKELIDIFYQNKPSGYHVDHIIPIAKGGLHRLDNLQYLLPKQNGEKAARLDYGKAVDDTKTTMMGRSEIFKSTIKRKRRKRRVE